jgi:hypothetical protein
MVAAQPCRWRMVRFLCNHHPLGSFAIEIDALSIDTELAYVAMFVGLAFGIERRSRAAAVIPLSVYVLNFLLITIQRGPRRFLAAAPISVALLNAVRGTFAYHKLRPITRDAKS